MDFGLDLSAEARPGLAGLLLLFPGFKDNSRVKGWLWKGSIFRSMNVELWPLRCCPLGSKRVELIEHGLGSRLGFGSE